MAVPKRRQSSGRTNRRRSHDALKARSLSGCTQCGEPRMPHRVCAYCGHYDGEKVLDIQVADFAE